MEKPNLFSGEEDLSFYPPYSIPEVLEILARSESKSHVKFHGIEFNKPEAVHIWRKYGRDMNNIEFFDCTFDTDNVIALVESLSKVTRLSYDYEHLIVGQLPFHSDAVLKSIVENRTVQRSLKTLSIRVNDIKWISARTLPLLFSIYPNVVEFSIYFKKSDVDIRAEAIDKNETTSYSMLHTMISSEDDIVGVKLKLPGVQFYEGFTIRLSKPASEYSRSAHELEANVYESPNDLIEYCARRKNLESVECTVETEAEEDNPQKEIFAVNFLKRVLNECPKLRLLSLNIDPSYNVVSVDATLFSTIIASRLETLKLSCEEMKIVEDGTRIEGNNSTMRKLWLKVNDQDTMITFLKRFTQLETLVIFNAEDDVLQAIWQYQSTLTSLELLNVVPYTWAFTGRGDENSENYDAKQNTGISIDRLKNLVNLTVEAIEPDWNATDDIFDHFIFPNLRYLDLEIMDNSGITTRMMSAIEANVPQVETINLRYYNEVSYNVWKQLCDKMKHLRNLTIWGDSSIESKYTDHEYQTLFIIRPTLHTLSHKHAEGQEVFYYNVAQKKVLKSANFSPSKRSNFNIILQRKIQV